MNTEVPMILSDGRADKNKIKNITSILSNLNERHPKPLQSEGRSLSNSAMLWAPGNPIFLSVCVHWGPPLSSHSEHSQDCSWTRQSWKEKEQRLLHSEHIPPGVYPPSKAMRLQGLPHGARGAELAWEERELLLWSCLDLSTGQCRRLVSTGLWNDRSQPSAQSLSRDIRTVSGICGQWTYILWVQWLKVSSTFDKGRCSSVDFALEMQLPYHH